MAADESVVDPQLVFSHLAVMRRATGVAALLTVVAAGAGFFLPPLRHPVITPMWATFIAAAAALWVGFSANRDARERMDRIKRAYAVHGEMPRLLRDHFLAYLVVLARLGAMSVGGVIVALWGFGPTFALFIHVLVLFMVALSWPSEAKTRLLIRRAESMR